MSSPPPRRFQHSVLLAQFDPLQVLLLHEPQGWALPHFEADEHNLGEVEYINQAIHAQLGVTAITLRCVLNTLDPATAIFRRIHVLENHSPDWTPPSHGQWVRRETVKEFPLAQPDHRAVLESWLQKQKTEQEVQDGREWALPGWWEQATAWIGQQLSHHGYGELLTIEQRKAWEFSCVLRVHTTKGEFYFKAVPHSLAREPSVTPYLAHRHSQHVPEVIAAEPQRRWFLMRSVQGVTLRNCADLFYWERVADTYARLQLQWTERTAELLALGCPQRTLNALEQEIDPLLADTPVLMPGDPEGLSLAEITWLRGCAAQFKAMCHELARYAIPFSLDHGDLWAGNIIASADGPVFIDWDEAAIQHPFFSFFELLLSAGFNEQLTQVPDARTRIRAAYLGPWTKYEPMDRLVAAFDLSQQLAALHFAINYRRWLALIETTWELGELIPFFLKQLVPSPDCDAPPVVPSAPE